ncbi:MAG: hypothetical protein GAK29_04068 [Acinetobacter bereziniae]|uniref:DUF1287 domain-containing protein n=1 Tax=Acinetobacter bereziniae TaxID=106648 RepID=A0A833UNL4_ACIBZ|nr:MAG: hypothetical protein GAK29_04068 [Acinetobacter bereziniae]
MIIKIFQQLVSLVFLSFMSVQIWAFQAEKLVNDARFQIWKTLYYDPSYTQLKYPMGDVPLVKGVCTDVVIRALRHQDIDLQKNP